MQLIANIFNVARARQWITQ